MESRKMKMNESDEKPSDLVAKKDFEIHQGDFHLVIKAGDDLRDVPKVYHENLKTEGVI